MRRVALFTLLLSLAVGAIGQRPAPAIVALLRDPSGAPIAEARGWLRADPAHSLPALAHLPDALGAPLPNALAITATSDARGILRFLAQPSSAGRHHAGSGYVTTKHGLGAILPRLHAGRAQRITLRPLAAVTTPGGSETFTLYARALLDDGQTVLLPALHGTEVRLPAGTYEIWAHDGDSTDWHEGLVWQRLQLQSGARHTLTFGGQAQQLEVQDGAFVHPSGRPELLLPHRDGRLVLRGPALAAPLVSYWRGVVTPPRVVPGPPTKMARTWPPIADRTAERESFGLGDGMPDDCWLFGLVRNDDRTFRVVGFSRADQRAFALPPRAQGDDWLLLLAPGYAPHAQPWSTTAPGSKLVAAAGVPFVVHARDERNLPIADLRIEYTPTSQDAAAVRARSDASGHATFGRVRGPGTLFVADARFANQRIELETVPAEPFELVARVGGTCRGTAALAGGAANRTIVVTLRDGTGRLQPATRTVVVASGKAFSFAGLPEGRDLVLFATAQHNGKTWSVRQLVQAGDDVTLTLQNEDPEPFGDR